MIWYENGMFKSEGELMNGVLNGLYIEAYKSGKSKKKTFYINGLEEGVVVLWYDNGIKVVLGIMSIETVND